MKKNILVSAFLVIISFSSALANNVPISPLEVPGRAHNILSNKLPVRLLSEMKRAYKSYWITDLYKQGDKKHVSYTITVENPDRIIEMRSTDSRNWVVTSTKIKAA